MFQRALPAAVAARGYADPADAETASIVVMPGIAGPLQRLGQTVHCQRSDVVEEAGDPADYVYKVVSGTLRAVRVLADGRRHIAKFLTAGDFFGIAEGEEYGSSLEAITDATLMRYPRRSFEATLESDAATGRQLFNLICRQLEASNHLLLLLGRKTAAERLASFLLSFRQQENPEICLPMCRSDIADHLGLTIETVSRVITKFRQQQWIRLQDASHIVITAPDKLEALAAD
jgi:CRP/FNR family transcriptional regulator